MVRKVLVLARGGLIESSLGVVPALVIYATI